MGTTYFSAKQAAAELAINVTTLYDWLAHSDGGTLVIRGTPFTIDYLQGGQRGQGRIRIATEEVNRLHEAMRVTPQVRRQRLAPVKLPSYPGINVPLGRPGGTT